MQRGGQREDQHGGSRRVAEQGLDGFGVAGPPSANLRVAGTSAFTAGVPRKNLLDTLRGLNCSRQTYKVIWVSLSHGKFLDKALRIVTPFQ